MLSSRRHFFERMVACVVPAGLLSRIDFGSMARRSGQEAHRSDETIDVRDHGATGDGSTDDTSAIESAASSGENLFFPPGRYRITRDLSLTPRLALVKGAVMAVDPGQATLTIQGSVDAGLYQIFSGSIAFGPGAVSEVYPQWWGARGDGVNDDSIALQSAFDAGIVRLPAGRYRTTRPLTAESGMRLEGVGNLWNPDPSRDSWIIYDGPEDSESAVIRASRADVGTEPRNALSNVAIRGVVLDGGGKAGYGLYAAYCTNDSAFSDVTVIRTTQHGLWANKLWYARIENVVARNNFGCGITIGERRSDWSSSSVVNGIHVANLRAHSNGRDRAYNEESNPEWGYGIGFYPGNAVILRTAVSERNFGPGIVFGLGGGTANGIEGFYVEENAVGARKAGSASHNWGLVVVGHANARGNEVTNGRLGGSVGRANAQAVWLRGDEPTGTLVLKNLSFGQYLRADWANYRLEGAIYYGLANYIEGNSPVSGPQSGSGI